MNPYPGMIQHDTHIPDLKQPFFRFSRPNHVKSISEWTTSMANKGQSIPTSLSREATTKRLSWQI